MRKNESELSVKFSEVKNEQKNEPEVSKAKFAATETNERTNRKLQKQTVQQTKQRQKLNVEHKISKANELLLKRRKLLNLFDSAEGE